MTEKNVPYQEAVLLVIYLTEATLTTVETMVTKKTLPKFEFSRQCAIAQRGVDFLFWARARVPAPLPGRINDALERPRTLGIFGYYNLIHKKNFG